MSSYKRTVYERLSEVVPVEKLENLDITEVEKSLKISCEIIGYSPENLEKSFEEAWKTVEADSLFEFIYKAWEIDYESKN